MDAIQQLRSELSLFWNEAGITYDEYCRNIGPRGGHVPKVAEWEEKLDSFPSRVTFEDACVQFCTTGLIRELDVLKEAISIDIESYYFIEVLWNMRCRNDEVLSSLLGDGSRNVRMQTVWLLRDIGELWALAKLKEMRAVETDTLVIIQLNGVIAFMEDPDSLDRR